MTKGKKSTIIAVMAADSKDSPQNHSNFWLIVIVVLLVGLGAQDYLSKTPFFGGGKKSTGASPTPPSETALLTYTDAQFNFSLRYPETLKITHEYDEAQLRDLPIERKAGEPIPYLEIHLEEANPPDYQPQSGPEGIMRNFLGFLPPFQTYSQPQKLASGYKIDLVIDRNWLSENLPELTEKHKKEICLKTERSETVAVTDVYIDGYEARKISCGAKILSAVVLDPRNESRYFKITGRLTTDDPSRKDSFLKAYEKIINFFRFSIPQEPGVSPV